MISVAPILAFGAQYWKLFAVGALIAGAYIKGCSDANENFDSYKAQVEAQAEAQLAWKKARIVTQKEITDEKDKAHLQLVVDLKSERDRLTRRLRDATATRQLVPALPKDAGGRSVGTQICFERDKLDGGIRGALGKFLEGAVNLLHRGDSRSLAFLTCGTTWDELEKLGRGD